MDIHSDNKSKEDPYYIDLGIDEDKIFEERKKRREKAINKIAFRLNARLYFGRFWWLEYPFIATCFVLYYATWVIVIIGVTIITASTFKAICNLF